MRLSRRRLLSLAALGAAGLSLPARAAPDDPRLVLVVLRGALDGLAALPPVGDPALDGLRPEALRPADGPRLDDTFALHPGLAPWRARWAAGELLPLCAVATPLRDRSHFAVQDCLEQGGAVANAHRDGWLYRALAAAGQLDQAAAIGRGPPLVLRGATPVPSIDPGGEDRSDDAIVQAVAALWAEDPALGPAITEALGMRAVTHGDGAPGGDRGAAAIRGALGGCAGLLVAEGGPRVLSVELSGWDTHADQARRLGLLLPALADGVEALARGLGPAWRSTAVLCVTEFGRTAAANGTGGTDHGTGAAAFALGGAIAGGRVLGEWPGLRRAALYEGRDLRPTLDLRAVFAGLLRDHLRLPEAAVDAALPGVRPLDGLVRTA
ncbi:MAG: hypothetical protein RL071_804 [Pseudomonadota bacterium]|jgi:uncharacterized protein (DUF1501 family)